MSTLSIKTQNLDVVLMRPDTITADWVNWPANPALMREANARTQQVTTGDIKTYVLEAMAQQRAILGLFQRKPPAHAGIIEIVFDQNHRNMNLEVLIDFQKHDAHAILDEVMPPLLTTLRQRFGAEKAVMVVPETAITLLSWLARSAWSKEGVLRAELPHATERRRIDAIQFGLPLNTAAPTQPNN